MSTPLSIIKYTQYNSYYKARVQQELRHPGRYLTPLGAQRILTKTLGHKDAIVYAVEHIAIS